MTISTALVNYDFLGIKLETVKEPNQITLEFRKN
jgi:hypothetical protein